MKMQLSNAAASGAAIVLCLACGAGNAQDIGGLGNKLGGMAVPCNREAWATLRAFCSTA
jgi:hypothetical protein